MSEERICHVCGRTNPIDQPRCINCGQRTQGMMLVAEKPATTNSWWSGSTDARAGAIPAPPQVREEVERAETARLDQERRQVERDRRLQAAKERDERLRAERQGAAVVDDSAVTQLFNSAFPQEAQKAAPIPAPVAAPMALQTDCTRCGMPTETTASGQGFSFCFRCGTTANEAAATQPFATPQVAQQVAYPQTVAQMAGEKDAEAVQQAASSATTGGNRRVAMAQTVAVANPPSMGVSPGLAAAMSFCLPGVGQLVNGQVAKSALLFLAMFVLIGTFHLSPFAFFAIAVRVMAAVDAHRIAERRRKGVSIRDGEWDLG